MKLYTTVTYQDLLTVMVFEAHNTRDFDVEVELELRVRCGSFFLVSFVVN